MDSLRDINIRLKNGDRGTGKRTKKDPIVFKIWFKKKNVMKFFTKVPILNRYKDKWPRNKCPYCGDVYSRKNIVEQNSTSWVFKCPGCKSLLTVYND